jgi:hypothetical protein
VVDHHSENSPTTPDIRLGNYHRSLDLPYQCTAIRIDTSSKQVFSLRLREPRCLEVIRVVLTKIHHSLFLSPPITLLSRRPMILIENGESSSSKPDEVLDAEGPATIPNSSPTAPPSYVARNAYVATNDKTPAFGNESERPASSSTSPSFYASGPLSAIAGPSDSGRSQQDSDGSSLFSRVPPRELSYSPFQPMYLLCKGKTMDKGFPRAPPPSSIQPHPFNSHDITEGDWLRFVIIRISI